VRQINLATGYIKNNQTAIYSPKNQKVMKGSNLKRPNIQCLNKNELLKIKGGVIDLIILNLYLHRKEINEFMQGFVDGFKENKT
jgi:hypothetical protein